MNCLDMESYLQKSGNSEKMGELLNNIGEILVKEKFIALALNLFGLSGNPYRALEVFKPIL